MCSLELQLHGICDAIHGTIFFAVRIIQCLDASSAGDVILCSGYFQLCVIGKWTSSLHQSLTKSFFSDQHSAIIILERPGNDLGGRCTPVAGKKDRKSVVQG